MALSSVGRFGDGMTHGSPVSSKYIERRQPVEHDDIEAGADAEGSR